MKTYSEAERIELVFSGTDYFSRLENMIDACEKVLHVQTYIFETDPTGMRIVEALKRAAARKVEIFVLPDAFGSNGFASSEIKKMKALGINFRFFSPLFSKEGVAFGRRLHHKIVVADKRMAIIAGINIADKYNLGSEVKPWLDYGVYVKGNICEYLHLLCEKIYFRKSAKALNKWERNNRGKSAQGASLIRFRRNDWLKGKNEIRRSYEEALRTAEHSVTIVGSYFLPGYLFRRLLKNAAARGVEVNIILAGLSDVSSVRLAEIYLYEFYNRHNIKIYEWHNSVMHGKLMLVDDKWATVGSYNHNYLSHYISIELNADIKDRDFVKTLGLHLKQLCERDCVFIDARELSKRRGWKERLKMLFAFYLHKLVMVFMLMGKRRKTY
jgi:cardiolipin synthase A/B